MWDEHSTLSAGIQLRGIDDGPLFCYNDGSPLSRSGLVDKVSQYLHQGGVDPIHYSGHSFRIGAATTAAAKGVTIKCWDDGLVTHTPVTYGCLVRNCRLSQRHWQISDN